MSINVQNFNARKHRTALFVDAQKRAKDAGYKERSDRLIQSLNGDNIKVDIFEVDGLTIRPFGTTPKESTNTPTDADLRSWAAKTGYEQVLVSMSAQA